MLPGSLYVFDSDFFILFYFSLGIGILLFNLLLIKLKRKKDQKNIFVSKHLSLMGFLTTF